MWKKVLNAKKDLGTYHYRAILLVSTRYLAVFENLFSRPLALTSSYLSSTKVISVPFKKTHNSGILACIRFMQQIPNLDICVYDKNANTRGTWFEN